MRDNEPEPKVSAKKLVRRDVRFAILMVLLALAIFGLPLFVGVWVPDMFDDSEHVLAEAASSSGYKFRVVQHWNHVDFYTTELLVIRPDGMVDKRMIDWDDDKHWTLPLVIDEQRRLATISKEGWIYEQPFDYPGEMGGRKETAPPKSQPTR